MLHQRSFTRIGAAILGTLSLAAGCATPAVRPDSTSPQESPPSPAALQPAPPPSSSPPELAASVSNSAVQPDAILVNGEALMAAEVLYVAQDAVLDLYRERNPESFGIELRDLLARQTRQEIGSLLLYQKASRNLVESQKETLERTVTEEHDRLVTTEFGGSSAALEAKLKSFGLTPDQFKAMIRRQVVVRVYARETLLPKSQLRRDELLRFYRENETLFSSPELRELLLIEAPFAKFLPEGLTWDNAPQPARAQARLAAVRHIRAAQAALSGRTFADVAKEFCRGPQGHNGGSWGLIGMPLKAAYEPLSSPIFTMSQGQIREPLETETGWYIIGCGQVQPATKRTFTEAQPEIREKLSEQKFNEALSDYVAKLAQRASIGPIEPFVREVATRAQRFASGRADTPGAPLTAAPAGRPALAR